jgi:hypothetical protein
MCFPEHEHPELALPREEVKKVEKNEKSEKNEKICKRNEQKNHNLRVNVPPKATPAFRPAGFQNLIRRDLGDITPTIFASMGLGIVSEDYEPNQEVFGVTTPLAFGNSENSRNEPPSGYQLILPEYCLQSSFQHYISPRNSQ